MGVMRQITAFLLVLAALVPAFAEKPYLVILRQADDHFANREWGEAVALYDVLLNRRPDRITTYVSAVVSSAASGNDESVMRYVVRSERQGLSLDSLFAGVDSLARSIGRSDIYEGVLLLVKKNQPWFTRVANNYLLEYYRFRRDPRNTLLVADELLAVSPGQVNCLKAKAEALLLQGNDSAAVLVQRMVLEADTADIEANLFVGGFYAVRGMEKLRDVDERYLGDSGREAVEPMAYKEEKQKILRDEIALARRYLSRAAGVRANQYLAEQLARLASLTDELPSPPSRAEQE